MAYYRCSLRTPDGRTVELELEAIDEHDLRSRLAERWDEVLCIQKLEELRPGPDQLSSWQSHQLVSELAAGQAARLPADQVLEAAACAVSDARLAAVLKRAAEDCRQGTPLGQVLTGVRMPARYRAYLVAALETPQPAEVFLELLSGLVWRQRLRRQLLAALAYPLLSLLVVTFLTVIIVATLDAWMRFLEISAARSMPLQVLLVQSTSFILTCGVLVLLRGTLRRSAWEWLVLSSPVFGEIYEGALFVPWLRMMATLVQAGLPADQAIRTAGQLSGSGILEANIEPCIQSVRRGMPLGEALSQCYALPRTVLTFIRWSEERHCLEQGFIHAANYLTGKVELAARRVPVIVAPIALALAAIAVLHTVLLLMSFIATMA
ncbi:MAG: hypothetical protein KatS3mg110_4205 [Pirellulaceae bacterium]|nr:MAG: hypothetical protein KatS3mg110_4205 [Pirellulaceae bacterium]